jgi:GNAT superfamily N-acetyltransferase
VTGAAEVPAFRRASVADAVALLTLEQEASTAALTHVFPPERYPYPAADVLARWHLVLADPDTEVVVLDGEEGLDAAVAYDASGTLRQLAVTPSRWGTGLGTHAVRHAVSVLRRRGHDRPRLWCLADNVRARAFYERLGWRVTGETQPAPWPPYPTEVEYVLVGLG